jgi:hypothetical protein
MNPLLSFPFMDLAISPHLIMVALLLTTSAVLYIIVLGHLSDYILMYRS